MRRKNRHAGRSHYYVQRFAIKYNASLHLIMRHPLNSHFFILTIKHTRSDAGAEQVTCQILSPFTTLSPSPTVVRNSMSFTRRSWSLSLAWPIPAITSIFCTARLICRPAKDQAAQAMLAKVVELPLGEQAARLLDDNKRAQGAF